MRKKTYLLTVSFIIQLLLLYSIPITASKGDFYTRLFETGKRMYLEGDYEEAAKDLKIAEFGLYERPEILKELYLYYALANFKLKRGDDVVAISKKILAIYKVDDAAKIRKPEPIENDLDAMFSAVFKNYRPAQTETNGESAGKSVKKRSRPTQVGKEKMFNLKFAEIKSYLDANLLKETEKGLKVLEKIKKGDLRIGYLKGVLAFRKRDYKKAVKILSLISKKNISELKEDVFYYLSLSHYFVKNYGQTVAFSQKITKPALKKKLSDILNKVKTLRKNSIIKNSNSMFDKREFREAVKKFEGDPFIPRDILQTAINSGKAVPNQIKSMIGYSLKHPDIYEKDFIFLASDYFSERHDIKYAIKILKESKFYGFEKPENTEIFYRAAVGYFKLKSYKKAEKLFKKVLKLSPSYKKTYFYLDNLKNLH